MMGWMAPLRHLGAKVLVGAKPPVNARARARESLKSHGRWVANRLRAGAYRTRSCHANVRCSRLNRGHQYVLGHVASQSKFRPDNADGRPAQVVDVTLRIRPREFRNTLA